ncbi:hypothetical protein Tco_0282230 [Tanacetum coccineum]
MTVDDLIQLVPQLMTRVDSLEKDLKQTKLTMGSAIVKLVKKVKKLEGILKRRNVVLSDSEERTLRIRGGKVKMILYTKVSTVSGQVNTDSIKKSIPSPDKGQREGKAPMIIEETPKKTKEQILQEEASLTEAIRLDTLEKEEEAKQVHLDSLLAQKLAEEEELNEQQKQRRAQVQFEAQHYTNEDWDLIRAKIEANAELSKSVLGSGLQGEDFAKKMVELVNQRKKHFAEERARAKRNKPITQSQLRTYMMNYLKNQGTWKLSQLKNLSFEEVKEEFDKLVKQVESFAPINFEATKDSLKRLGKDFSNPLMADNLPKIQIQEFKGQATPDSILTTLLIKADDLDVYTLIYDELNTAKVTLMANLSHYGSYALAKNYSFYNPLKFRFPKELPKVSMVNTSLKKLKHHLAGFDVVVKERTTPTAITEGSWGDNSVSNQSAPSFDQLFELNELKAQSQEKDTVIKKLKERIKSLSGKMNEDKIKKDLEEIETIILNGS